MELGRGLEVERDVSEIDGAARQRRDLAEALQPPVPILRREPRQALALERLAIEAARVDVKRVEHRERCGGEPGQFAQIAVHPEPRRPASRMDARADDDDR